MMKPGTRIEVEITDLAFGGDGVGRSEGIAVFVPFTIPGERVLATVVQSKKRFCRADLHEILVASPDRVEAPCPYYGLCGGCCCQHIAAARQLALKTDQLRGLLQRIGKLAAVPAVSVVAAPKPYGYRNRITVHCRAGVVGYYHSRRDAPVVDIEACLLADDDVSDGLAEFRSEPHPDGAYEIRSASVSRDAFEQVNVSMYESLVAAVRAALAPAGGFLFEGYCGNGFLTRTVHEAFTRVVAVDMDQTAVREAETRQLENTAFSAGDVERRFVELGAKADTVLVDPPRTGLSSSFIAALGASGVERLVYVACDAARFARDAHLLSACWRLTALDLLDMFPQTAHMEMIGAFERVHA